MGEETTQFASRFSEGVKVLAELAAEGAGAGAHPVPAALAAAVRGALEAVEAVYATETSAMRDWPEERRRVLAQLAAVRRALESTGAGEEVRSAVRALVRLVDPGMDAGGGAPAARRRR